MENKLVLYGVGGLVAGFILGFMVSPVLMGNVHESTLYGGMHKQRSVMNNDMMEEGMMGNIDRHFIEMMIPHHEGAIAMARLALETSKRPEILSLADGIIEAQTREIEQMQEWYTQWFGTNVKDFTAMNEMMGHGGMGMHMMGMEGDLNELKTALNFDIAFINQMIPHHEMAIMMAQMLQAGTQRPEMRELADQIITSQSREIEMMKSWRNAWATNN